MNDTENINPQINNRWKVKDFITLAVFNIIILVIMNVSVMVLNLILTPVGAFYAGGIIPGLLGGPFYMVMANRIQKRGVLFFSMLLAGIMFGAMGFWHYLVAYLLFGAIGELCMLGTDSYIKPTRNTVGYSLYLLAFGLIGVFPLLFFREQYLAAMEGRNLEQALLYSQPVPLLISSLITIVSAVIGCRMGNQILKRHVKKAKLS